MILPVGAPSFREALRQGVEVFHALKGVLQADGLGTSVGDEGGFAPNLPSNDAAIEVILGAIEKAGFKAGTDIWLGLDVASSEFHRNGCYELASEGRSFTSDEFVELLVNWAERYPILSIEDGLAEDDWSGWKLLTERLGRKSPTRRRRPVRHKYGNPATRHRGERRECNPHQTQSDRHAK
ncbi:phosphopyruvate hydratase [Caballeronia calidae]|uniref:Enolase n=1 Tax=Caballeronia calidae TaxID=1777139 RepID=A0A158E9S1_9BURK|nr:phosphopyruvate hydratase [Caballeronia calidae]